MFEEIMKAQGLRGMYAQKVFVHLCAHLKAQPTRLKTVKFERIMESTGLPALKVNDAMHKLAGHRTSLSKNPPEKFVHLYTPDYACRNRRLKESQALLTEKGEALREMLLQAARLVKSN